MMRAETRAHQSRAAHPPDKACDVWPGGGGRGGAPRKRSREGGENDEKNTNRYLHNQWQVGNLYVQKPIKVEESDFGSVLVKSWL